MEATQFLPTQVEQRLIRRLLHACVREKLLPGILKNNLLFIPLKHGNQSIFVNNVQQFELNKFKINGDIILIANNQMSIMNDMPHFLNLMYNEIKDSIELDQWQKFVSEINNCVANDALVEKYIHDLNQELATYVQQSQCNSLVEYIDKHYNTDQQLMFFERWAAKGHPYHPCHKTKLGFNKKAYLKFSPEFNEDINLPLAALDKSLLHIESEETFFNYHAWFSQQFPQQWNAWYHKMDDKELTHYLPIFIHPWQYDNVLTKLFPDLINSKQLRLFNDICITTKASLSFRTLMSKEDSTQPHIKLPVAVHSTSAMRTISPASVQNGPKLGAILKQILRAENHFNHQIKLAYEICGLHIKNYASDIAKHLAIIYRQNPSTLIANKTDLPIVAAALFEISPHSQLPLFIEILQTATDGTLASALQYFDHYCRVVIEAFFDLFLIYGIALEGHQQNTIVVFNQYKPSYMIARDLGGLRIHAPTLTAQGYAFEPYPDSATITNNALETTNKFLHTVIQYHLGELVLLLSDHFQTQEQVFWNIIKENIEQRFHVLRDRIAPERWQKEYNSILRDDWQLKGLMRMRLNNVYNKYIYINLKNPLRDA